MEDVLQTPHASKTCDIIFVKPIKKVDASSDDVSLEMDNKIIFILFLNFIF